MGQTDRMMESSPVGVTMPKQALRLVVRFCDKKFMVLVAHNALFKDVKQEILRVYKGICPSLDHGSDLSVSELRDYSGCILFDEYEVGMLVQDLTKIVAIRSGEEDSLSSRCTTPLPGRSFTPLLQVRSHLPHCQPNICEHPSLSVASPSLAKVGNSSSLSVIGSPAGALSSSLNMPTPSPFLSQVSTPVLHIDHLNSTLSNSREYRDESPVRQSTSRSKTTNNLPSSEENITQDSAPQLIEPKETDTHQNDLTPSKSHDSLCLRPGSSQYGCETAGHPDDTLTPTKSPFKAHSQSSTPEAVAEHLGPQSIEPCDNTGNIQDNTGSKRKCVAKESEKEDNCTKDGVKKSSANGSRMNKRSALDKSSSKQKQKLHTYSYSSSEEVGDTSLNTLTRIKRKRPLPPKKKKGIAVKSASEASGSIKMPRRSKRISKRNKVEECDNKPGLKKECASTLKAKAEVHYPGYSSGWSSAESGSAHVEGVKRATEAVKVRKQSADQDHDPRPTDSTTARTSSERDQKVDEKVTGPPESEDGVNSQVSGCHNNVTNVDQSSDGCAADDKEMEIPTNSQESVPLAPDSIDMETQLPGTSSNSQGRISSDVTVIPDTQEMLSDTDNDSSAERALESPASPVIPLQNGGKATDFNNKEDVVKSSGNEKSSSHKAKASCVPGGGPSQSDVESELVIASAASNQSTQVSLRQKQEQLLQKIIEKGRCSDVSDSTSIAKIKDSAPCLRKKAKLTIKSCRAKKQPFRPLSKLLSDLDTHNGEVKVRSTVRVSRSDSENLALKRPLSLSRRREGTKPSMANIPVTVDDRGDSREQESGQEVIPKSKQQYRLTEDECLEKVASKEKEADSGVSSTNASEATHSSSSTKKKVCAKSQVMAKRMKTKNGSTKDVISISSGSESEAFVPPPFKKRKPRPRIPSQRIAKQTSVVVKVAPSKSTTEQPTANRSDSETADYNSLPEQCTKALKDEDSSQKKRADPIKTSPLSSEEESDLLGEDGNLEERDKVGVSGDKAKSSGNCSSKRGSVLTKEVWDSTSSEGSTESSESSDSDRDNTGKVGQRQVAHQSNSNDFKRENKNSGLIEVTDSSSSSCSSSDEEADSVAKPPNTHPVTTDKQSSNGNYLSNSSKLVQEKSSLPQKERKKPIPKEKSVSSPNPKPKGVVSRPPHLERSSSESESTDDEDTVTVQQPFPNSGSGRTHEPRKVANHSSFASPKKPLQRNKHVQPSSARGPPRFLFSRTATKKNRLEQLSQPVKQTSQPEGSCGSGDSAESSDDLWSSSEEEDEQPKKKTGSLEMLIPKGQQRTKAKPPALKPTSTRGMLKAPNQQRFSSSVTARMFSLAPSILGKHGKSKNRTTQISKHKPKVRESKASKKDDHKVLSLSQQEVLLAKGGSQKLHELLSDDKLWGETTPQ